jgi:hypothetical protein
MIVVELTDQEILICRILGNMRTLTSRADKTSYTDINYNLDIDEDGVVGELAFCKHWNIFFNPEARFRRHSYDAKLKDKRIDVKTTTLKNGRLQASSNINPDVDVFVLGIFEGNKVTFVGHTTAENLYRQENFMNLGRSYGYAIEQRYLTPWK